MRKFVCVWLIVFGLSIFVCGSSNDSPQGKGGDADLVGTWMGNEEDGDVHWTFVFGETSMNAQSDLPEVYEGSYTAFPSENPKRLEYYISSCDRSMYEGKTSHAIYKLDNGVLTFAANEPGEDSKPSDFTPTPNSITRVFTLTRQ